MDDFATGEMPASEARLLSEPGDYAEIGDVSFRRAAMLTALQTISSEARIHGSPALLHSFVYL